MKILSLLALCLLLNSCSSAETRTAPNPAHFIETISAQTFFKGNLHTHTNASDGNVSPLMAITWFKKHGYNFLAVTDHDQLTVDHSQDGKDFITINGVELTG
ncbi:MAG: PHP domain-containing protein, partial [Deltaproteobacteria bacterium]|nr:PHP domain-containing protein [Deltaproteobacteria bacterium]